MADCGVNFTFAFTSLLPPVLFIRIRCLVLGVYPFFQLRSLASELRSLGSSVCANMCTQGSVPGRVIDEQWRLIFDGPQHATSACHRWRLELWSDCQIFGTFVHSFPNTPLTLVFLPEDGTRANIRNSHISLCFLFSKCRLTQWMPNWRGWGGGRVVRGCVSSFKTALQILVTFCICASILTL